MYPGPVDCLKPAVHAHITMAHAVNGNYYIPLLCCNIKVFADRIMDRMDRLWTGLCKPMNSYIQSLLDAFEMTTPACCLSLIAAEMAVVLLSDMNPCFEGLDHEHLSTGSCMTLNSCIPASEAATQVLCECTKERTATLLTSSGIRTDPSTSESGGEW